MMSDLFDLSPKAHVTAIIFTNFSFLKRRKICTEELRTAYSFIKSMNDRLWSIFLPYIHELIYTASLVIKTLFSVTNLPPSKKKTLTPAKNTRCNNPLARRQNFTHTQNQNYISGFTRFGIFRCRQFLKCCWANFKPLQKYERCYLYNI